MKNKIFKKLSTKQKSQLFTRCLDYKIPFKIGKRRSTNLSPFYLIDSKHEDSELYIAPMTPGEMITGEIVINVHNDNLQYFSTGFLTNIGQDLFQLTAMNDVFVCEFRENFRVRPTSTFKPVASIGNHNLDIYDISTTGLSLYVPTDIFQIFQVLKTLDMIILTIGTDTYIIEQAQIVYSMRIPSTSPALYKIGVNFTKVKNEVVQSLYNQLKTVYFSQNDFSFFNQDE